MIMEKMNTEDLLKWEVEERRSRSIEANEVGIFTCTINTK